MDQKGFTLTELLIGGALFAIILGCANGLFGVGNKTYNQTYSQVTNIQENRQIESKITSELKYADTITAPASPQTSISYTVSGDSRQILFDQATKSVTFTTTSPVATTIKLAQNDIAKITFQMISGGGTTKKGEISVVVTFINQTTLPFNVLTMNDVYP